jgi:hypothetical protein
MDYMRQFSNDAYAFHTLSSWDLNRSTYTMGKGFIEFKATKYPSQNTILLQGTGLFGLDPNHPSSTQTVKALIKFQSDLAVFGNDFSRIDQFRAETNYASYQGPFVMFNGVITGKGVKFLGGPIIAKKHFTNMGESEIPDPFIDGDLYVAGNLNLDPASHVTGHIYNYAPDVPAFYLDVNSFTKMTGRFHNNDTCLWFLGDGTYRTTTDLGYYIDTVGANIKPRQNIVWSSTIAVPASGIIVSTCSNIGVKGIIVPRVTIVAAGTSASENSGNIVIIDDIWYKDTDGVSISSHANANSGLALLALNRIWLKKAGSGNDLSIRGMLYGSYGVSQKGGSGNSSMDHFPVAGPRAGKLYFSGTRNALFLMTANAYQDGGLTHVYDGNLIKYPPPGLPQRPMLVSYSVE